MSASIRIEGIRELNRAFAQISLEVKRDNVRKLREATEPARAKAEELAVSNIRNIGGRWSQMRLGVITRGVYLAPKARRRGGSPRPNLGGLLLKRSMLPAVREAQPEIVARLEVWLDGLAGQNGF